MRSCLKHLSITYRGPNQSPISLTGLIWGNNNDSLYFSPIRIAALAVFRLRCGFHEQANLRR